MLYLTGLLEYFGTQVDNQVKFWYNWCFDCEVNNG